MCRFLHKMTGTVDAGLLFFVRKTPKTTDGEEMKVRASVKRRCEFCQIIKRNGVIRVICSRDARHKQRQG